jgi:hypothetical protein
VKWTVDVHVDGTIEDDAKGTMPGLFWEGESVQCGTTLNMRKADFIAEYVIPDVVSFSPTDNKQARRRHQGPRPAPERRYHGISALPHSTST